ncbi:MULTISPECIES: hypothetical protein [Citrobacter]|uniref:hypothetical protein n=1 Tax=Citrobacter TaxID=544 RepID=UPI0011EDE5AB|nr:hypothetical protein [Citrobacter braakii]
MQTNGFLSLSSCLAPLYYRLLRIVATGLSATALVVALVCGIVALTPVRGPGDSAFYSLAGFIALAALVVFLLAGNVMLQLRMVRILTEHSLNTTGSMPHSPQDR